MTLEGEWPLCILDDRAEADCIGFHVVISWLAQLLHLVENIFRSLWCFWITTIHPHIDNRSETDCIRPHIVIPRFMQV
jgi:hypothetical protein